MGHETGTPQDVHAVALDVDGTIAGADHAVSARTMAAIAAVHAAGLPVFLLTGRSRRSVLRLARELGLRNRVAAANGSVAFDPVADVDTRVAPMSAADVTAAVGLHRSTGLALTWWERDTIWVDADGPAADELIALGESPEAIRVGDPDGIRPDTTLKMMLHGTPEALDAAAHEVRTALPDAARSMDTFWEFVAPDAHKWAALQHLLAGEIDPAHVLGIGDGGNDVPWLSRIGHPVAMANARDEVKALTRRHTLHHADDGAAVVLEELAAELDRARH
ncbi:HAD family hydrolase [Microbacterium mcarthurae (nom. nud.)]|jgi:Cof subfamily protein (haloacid dehalogenase superfamily)|uniref:HAD family hydrolase n=1 Tax=Microbacterium mcarthurae TaxID=3035918 RepID=A0ABW9GEL1_9MICO